MHWHVGRSQAQIADSLGVDRKTVRKYVAPAEAAGLTPGGPALSPGAWAELVAGWFPQLVDTRLRQVTWPEIEVHHEYIRGLLVVCLRNSMVS
jgi:predicted transcriptional regulator